MSAPRPDSTIKRIARPRRAPVDTVTLPGDKSISHRAILFAAVAEGRSTIRRPLLAGDAQASVAFARALGATVTETGADLVIDGTPKVPRRVETNCGRSGTTLRLGAGILCGLGCAAHLSADEQLLARPMARITQPLTQMGADLSWTGTGMHIAARTDPLKAITYASAVPSAQVKSAVLLAGVLGGTGATIVERVATRDHTERLLRAMGAMVTTNGAAVTAAGHPRLSPLDIDVPGDMSSAATLATAAALIPSADVTLQGVGANPTRTAFWSVLERLGVEISHTPTQNEGPEPIATVRIRGRAVLQNISLHQGDVARLIDEVMLIALLACTADGESVIAGAGELRVKESDRLSAMVRVLGQFGAQIEATGNDVKITGPRAFRPAVVTDTARDHRVVFLAACAALRAAEPSEISGADYAADSFPQFFSHLERWMTS